jgi:kynurenine formamidase
MQYIDLTQTFSAQMPVYPGDSVPELTPIDSDGIRDHRLNTGMHVGTHMDAPLHMIAGGKRISEIDPAKFFGSGKLIDARGMDKIGPEVLADIQAGDIVLVLTGFGSKFHDFDYYEKYPELTEAFANKLVELKVKIVGLDTPSPDRKPFAVHKILLGQEILIIENLTNLEQLLNQKFEVVALPAKLETDAALTRVIAKII